MQMSLGQLCTPAVITIHIATGRWRGLQPSAVSPMQVVHRVSNFSAWISWQIFSWILWKPVKFTHTQRQTHKFYYTDLPIFLSIVFDIPTAAFGSRLSSEFWNLNWLADYNYYCGTVEWNQLAAFKGMWLNVDMWLQYCWTRLNPFILSRAAHLTAWFILRWWTNVQYFDWFAGME